MFHDAVITSYTTDFENAVLSIHTNNKTFEAIGVMMHKFDHVYSDNINYEKRESLLSQFD